MAKSLDDMFIADETNQDTGLDSLFTGDPVATVEQAPDKDLSGKLDESWDRRQDEVEDLRKRYELGHITKEQFDLRSIGHGAGYMGDVVGDVVVEGVAKPAWKHAIKPMADATEWLMGDTIINATNNAAVAAWEKFSTSSVAESATEAIGKGYKYYKKWATKNPDAAEDLEAFVNIGLLFTPYKTRPNAAPTTGKATEVGDDLIQWGTTQTNKTRSDKTAQMLTPEMPTRAQLDRTNQVGIFRTNVIKPDDFEAEMIKNVSRIKGLNTNRSPVHYYEQINKEIGSRADKLVKDLDKTGVILPHSTVIKKINQNLDETLNKYFKKSKDKELRESIKDDIEEVKAIILKHGETPSGVLAARKEIDNVIRDLYKFEEGGVAALPTKSASLEIIRRSLNDAIIESVPNVGVRKSLNYQFSLYRAKDAIEDKAINDAKNGVGRAFKHLTAVIDLKMQSNRTLAVLGGQSAFAIAGGFYKGIGAGFAAYGAMQVAKTGINSPKTKFAFGHLLKQIDRAIQVSKNGKMKEALRADRIIVQDLFELPVQKEETNTEK
jgi:hypothetical protein